MDIATTLALVFSLVALGYAIAWRGLLREGTGAALNDFTMTIAIPVLLFRTLVGADFGDARPFALWSVYFGAITVTWSIAHLVIRRGFGRDARAGVIAGLSAGYSNLVLLGIPVILAIFGRAGSETLSMLIAVHLPVMMGLSIVLHGLVAGRGGGEVSTGGLALATDFALTLARNPIVIGIIAGLAWRLFALPLPPFLAEFVDRLAGVAGTLALIALGMSLRRFGIARNLAQAGVVAALKLLLMPAIATLFALLLDLPAEVARVAVIAAALPTGVNPYLIANQLGTGEALASNSVLIATLLSPLALLFWAGVSASMF